MKKRFISKLLMAALVVVTMGVFSSCKDYDDDINANTALINQLQTQVKALEEAKASLEGQIRDANTAITAAQADATDALNKIKEAKAALEKAIADGDAAAIEEAQKRIDAAEARIMQSAQTIAEQEAAKAAAAAKTEMLNELQNQVTRLDAELANRYTKDEIDNLFKGVNDRLEDAVKSLSDDIAKLQNTDEALGKRLDDLYADYVSKGKFEEAITILEGKIGALDTKLMKLIDDKWIEANATFATITALEQVDQQTKINKAAIEELDKWVKNFDENVLPNLADKKALQDLEVKLTELINGKADKQAFEDAIALINETMATKTELSNAITDALVYIKDLLSSGYTSKTELNQALADLYTEITNEYTLDTQGKIDGLRTELLGAISTAIASIDNKLAGYATIEYVTTQISNLKIDELRTAMGKINAIESSLASMTSELNSLYNELKGMVITDNGNNEQTESGRLLVGENATGALDALKNLLMMMSDRIDALYDYVNNTLNGVDGVLNNITLFVTKNLTSIVYRPEGENAYLYGFPTIKALLLTPQPTYTFKFENGEDKKTTSNSNSSKQFDIIAKYWLNPSSTDVTKYDWSFDEVPAKNYITRNDHNADKAGVTVGGYKVTDGGILEVSLKIANGANVNNAKTVYDLATLTGVNADETTDDVDWLLSNVPSYAWITTVALQAVRNDENIASNDTVTSDYAIIVPEYYSNLLLANNKYKEAGHIEGNQKFHLRTNYSELNNENGDGIFSYKLAYNKADDLVDLHSIDIHYNGDKAIMTHEDAEFRGFTFKYTILTDADYFVLDEEKQTISIPADKQKNTSVGKVANVRVELQAGEKDDLKTFAYGYISIVITSPEVTVDLDPVDLNLVCNPDKNTWTTDNNTVAANLIAWDELINKIESKIGMPGAYAYYTWAVEEGGTVDETNLVKWASEKKVDDKKGIIGKNGANLTWTFTEAEVYSLFYDIFLKPAPKAYSTSLRLVPIDGHPELANVTVNVKIGDEIYPSGEFSYTQRIQQYWFNKESTKIAETAEARYEIHGNVEVVGQPDANDEFFFNIAASFFNSKFGQTGYEDPNAILVYDRKGYNYGDLATVYFDAEKYYVYNAADANKAIESIGAPATSFATGMSGTKYLLYIADRDSKVLMAVADKLDASKAQPVVELSETYNNVATFQGWTYFKDMVKDADGNITAGNALDYAYAYDLLNKNDHNEVGAGETFTTHMMLDQREYCFPIDFTGNDAYKFDIRWLRPISVDEQEDHVITDAVDNGTIIKLAEHAGFVDWRDIDFSANKRWSYINYYGIRAIKPNLDKAVTDINGGWTNIKYFPLLQFEDLTTEGVPPYTSGSDFIDQLGFVKYTNNGLNVGTFKIRMPITLLYDWGETAEQWIMFTIQKTTGQEITARQLN